MLRVLKWLAIPITLLATIAFLALVGVIGGTLNKKGFDAYPEYLKK